MTQGHAIQNRTLVDAFLEQERNLTAVERFARNHAVPGSRQESPVYSDLIPAHAPRPGEQYAFTVDLDTCSGCKACVTACHSLNGLDEEESWRRVGLLAGSGGTAVQHVTTACHHCVDPACSNGCPVLAYEKDAISGIVRHLDDQCIGCQYCSMMCPYEVPSYSPRLGIVRKCDMCSTRLSAGEPTACVQACPNGAIRIDLVRTAPLVETRGGKDSGPGMPLAACLVPGAPPSGFSLPTTRYTSDRGLDPVVTGADAEHYEPAHAHPTLVWMLVLTQGAVGMLLFAPWTGPADADRVRLGALVMFAVGLAAGTLHLGRPERAWRSFLGWRRSWLSREVIAFGGCVQLLALGLVLRHFGLGSPAVSGILLQLSTAAGVVGVGCSVMVYVATHRPFWGGTNTTLRFFGSVVVVGLASVIVLAGMNGPGAAEPVFHLLCGLVAAKVGTELGLIFKDHPEFAGMSAGTRGLHLGPLRGWAGGRILCAAAGCAAMLISAGLGQGPGAVGCSVAGFVLLVAGELLERHLFFRAVAPFRMPGGVPV